MPQQIAPGAVKAQELAALLQGQTEASSGEELWSTLVQLATERMLQEALEQEQAEVLGRSRYERRGATQGDRNGYEDGTLKTAEGVLRVKVPQVRGLQTPVTITTDGAPGLGKAVDAMWPRSPRIRCWFHQMQNFEQKVPPQAWPAFKALVADIRDAPTFEEGQRRCEGLLADYHGTFPEACRCLAEDTEANLNPLKVPPRHRQYVRTSHLAERLRRNAAGPKSSPICGMKRVW
jgi:transposase-like protein